ncbi:hypothetical protein Mtc_0649 [Methanocella conradii HZ254]|uniref:Uncharacterized protein n=1 Tax=Methanocella conradii (strain DSM 24694 / JCM 17849 / CGMCC 1.5162 / HZ254) TaxID=1041930 RepID=H8I6U3_METCZ|nr:hypothetical protein Mtc_0649 [Methanocella conradii HZ254]
MESSRITIAINPIMSIEPSDILQMINWMRVLDYGLFLITNPLWNHVDISFAILASHKQKDTKKIKKANIIVKYEL